MDKFTFTIEAEEGKARVGQITTPHGKIDTPVFMPVGTLGSVKTVSPAELTDLKAQIILANNYHLYLRPGLEIIRQAKGIHNFMSWEKPILTDSGGFQVFSLGKGNKGDHNLVKIKDDGVEFRSHLDGTKHLFTPEGVIKMQETIGADIIMCFDECAPHDSTFEYAQMAMERTHSWAKQALSFHEKQGRLSEYGHYQALFGIIQGVIFDKLRLESAKYISSLPFDGIAIGGLSVGEEKIDMHRTLDLIEPSLPREKPRYLMGVGSPEDLLEGVERGIDMFDCVLATRIARNGTVWTKLGRLNLNNAKYSSDFKPIELECDCSACQHFSRAYISHLIREKEILGIRLTTLHNLRFLMKLMEQVRVAIREKRFKKFKEEFLHNFEK